VSSCGGVVKHKKRLLWIALAVFVVGGSEGRGRRDYGSGCARTSSYAEVNHAIALAAGYLERACGPDGRFAYRIDIGSGQEIRSYNIIRHAGAMYALAMLNRAQPDRLAVKAMTRAATYLRQNYVGTGLQPGMPMIWS
jgi:hypothetical protein